MRIGIGLPKFKFLVWVAMMALPVFFSVPTQAQDDSEEAFNHEVDSYVRFMPAQSVELGSGNIQFIESESKYSFKTKVHDKLPVKFSLASRYISIKNTTPIEFPAHLTAVIGDIETTLPFFNFDKTYFRLGLSPAFYGDDWSFSSSDFRIPSRYFFVHKPNDAWTFVAGVAAFPSYEVKALPIFGVIYKPNEKWAFNLVPDRPNISYYLNDRLTLLLETGGYVDSEYKVTRDQTKNATLLYKEEHVGTGAKLKLNKIMETYLYTGYTFNRTLKYLDDLGKVNIDGGFYTEFRIDIKI